MADNEPQEPAAPTEDTTPLKPKVKRNFTPEQRAALAERMRKVNENRVARARVKNEAILEAKEAKTVAKLEEIKAKKEKVSKAKKEVEPPVEATPKPKTKKVIKKVVVQESSDSEDYADSTDEESEVEEVVYVQKKAAKPKAAPKPKAEKLMKEKAPSQPKAVAEPKVVFRFV
jgi:hypothetical protein